jgi:hypothetical protein
MQSLLVMQSCSSAQRLTGTSCGERWYIAKRTRTEKIKKYASWREQIKNYLTLANNNERMETNSYRLAETFIQMQLYGNHDLVQKCR